MLTAVMNLTFLVDHATVTPPVSNTRTAASISILYVDVSIH